MNRLLQVPNVVRTIVRNSGDHHTPYMGYNLPFSIKNHRTLGLKMIIFFSIPFWIPFLIVRYQLIHSR